MRFKNILASAVLAAGFSLQAAAPAAAFGWDRPPAGWGHEQVVRHWVYYPRYHHIHSVHSTTDPYAYRYSPRHYYPNYGSHYWVNPRHMRHPYRYQYTGPRYRYYPAWGYRAHRHHAPAE